MKIFLGKIKRACLAAKRVLIASLVFIFAVTLAAPVSAGVNLSSTGVDSRFSLGAGQNIFFGAATGGSGGNLMLLQDPIGTDRFRVDRSGNLTVAGTISASAVGPWTTSGSNIYNNNSGYVGIGNSSPTQLLTVGSPGSAGNSYYNIGANTAAVNSSFYSYGYICAGNGNGSCTGTGGVVIGPYNSSAAVSLGTNGYGYFAGYVGIGNNSPATNLDVNGNVRFGSQQGWDNPGGWNRNVLIDTTYHGRFRIKASSYTPGYGNIETYYWADSSTSPSAGIYSSHAFSINANGNNVVFPSGNVGIGTTNPTQKLDVRGGIAADILNSYTSGDPLELQYNIAGDVIVHGSDSNLQVQGTGNSSFSGNVGIGTTAPGAKLHVYNGGTYPQMIVEGGSNHAIFDIKTTDATAYREQGIRFLQNGSYKAEIYTYNNDGRLYFDVTGSNKMVINSSGNVGIGTTGPGYKLDVNGNMRATDIYNNGWFRNINNLQGLYNENVGAHFYASAANVWNMGGGGAYPQLIFRDNHQSTIRGYVYSDSSGFGLLHSGGGWAIRTAPGSDTIYMPGSVGIGTTDTSYGRLEVMEGNWGKAAVYAENGNGYGLHAAGGTAVWGEGSSYGVQGTGQTGVYGSGSDYGVYGSGGSQGVYGSGGSYGVNGFGNYGIYGYGYTWGGYFDNGVFSSKVAVRSPRDEGNCNTNINQNLCNAGILSGDNGSGFQYGLHVNSNEFSWGGDGMYFTAGYYSFRTVVGNNNLSEVATINSAGAYNQISDIRLKDNVVPIKDPLNKVLSLQGVNFNWKKEISSDPAPQIGFIAQDVEKVLPEVVQTNQEGFKSMQYGNMSALLVEAIKEQQAQIETLKADKQNLQAQNDSLNSRLGEIENKLGIEK